MTISICWDYFHEGDASHVEQAINAALGAKEAWETMEWEQRAAIFLKAADLLAGPYRAKINAATMLGQSKNAYQAEIDAACEFIDF
jgi:1-pyrroline-5-carboxylate dehydrogenase